MIYRCSVCNADLSWDRPSGVCSQACLEAGARLDLDKDPADMTANELDHAIRAHFPVHCQVMAKMTTEDPRGVIFADVEALSREGLRKKVLRMMRAGWTQSGGYFVRNQQEKPEIWKGE